MRVAKDETAQDEEQIDGGITRSENPGRQALTLPEPSVCVLKNAERNAHYLSSAACFEEYIIPATIHIDFVFRRWKLDRFVRHRLTVLRVEIKSIVGNSSHQLIVDIGVERAHTLLALIRHADASRSAKGHGEIAIQALHGRTVQEHRLIEKVIP